MSNNENFLLNESSTGGTGEDNPNKGVAGAAVSSLTLPPLPFAKNSNKTNLAIKAGESSKRSDKAASAGPKYAIPSAKPKPGGDLLDKPVIPSTRKQHKALS
jgi:hypothetical protein